MTVLSNRTSYAVANGYGRDSDGRQCLFVSVKATFTWDRSGRVTPLEPEPVLSRDVVVGEGVRTSILRAAELGPRKSRVDVLLAGAFVLPAPVEEVDASLEVGRGLRKAVRMMGPRGWIPGVVRDRVPSRPRPFARAPIDWRHSFGGASTDDIRFHEARNPAGCGLGRELTDYDAMPAPLFEDPASLISSSTSRPAPTGFGPIAAHWQPRVSRAGTYDVAWQQNRAPLPPADLNPLFHNVAPDDQQLASYVPGEEVQLRYMTVNLRDRFVLPPLEIPVLIATEDALVETRALVDTVVIEPEKLRFSLIARTMYALSIDGPIVYEVVVGGAPATHRRALEAGKRYLRTRPRRNRA